ncbi:hypothetical protein BC829DRAFT_448108 [Chytridium lagenaria]|nr:hypothetical protein BC829DRAFT_448108 [Chytridium lagenaria]
MPSITNILALLFAVLVTLTQAIPQVPLHAVSASTPPSPTFLLHTPAISPPFKPESFGVAVVEACGADLPSGNRRGGIFGVSAARTSSIVAAARGGVGHLRKRLHLLRRRTS